MNRYAIRTAIRSPASTVLLAAVITVCALAPFLIRFFIARDMNTIDALYENTQIVAEIIDTAPTAGFHTFPKSSVDQLVNAGFVESTYLQIKDDGYVATSNAKYLKYIKDTFGKTYRVISQKASIYAVSDISGFDGAQADMVSISYFDGYSQADFLGNPGVCVVEKRYFDDNMLAPGDTVGLASKSFSLDSAAYSPPMYRVIGTYELGQYANVHKIDNTAVFVNVNAHYRNLPEYYDTFFTDEANGYTYAKLTLQEKHRLSEFAALCQRVFPKSGQFQVVYDDSPLKSAVTPLENRISFLRLIEPYLFSAVMLISAAAALLSTRSFSKEVAIMTSIGVAPHKIFGFYLVRQLLAACVSLSVCLLAGGFLDISLALWVIPAHLAYIAAASAVLLKFIFLPPRALFSQITD